ncbi:hypothetical protein GGI17_004847 [Coemansia sp. S146]|nr:hypothetical protein GGI17_004847 [Coemansia sp. S146]
MPFQFLIGIAIFLLGLLLAIIGQDDAVDDEHLAIVGDDDSSDDAVTTIDDEQPAPVVQVVVTDEVAAVGKQLAPAGRDGAVDNGDDVAADEQPAPGETVEAGDVAAAAVQQAPVSQEPNAAGDVAAAGEQLAPAGRHGAFSQEGADNDADEVATDDQQADKARDYRPANDEQPASVVEVATADEQLAHIGQVVADKHQALVDPDADVQQALVGESNRTTDDEQPVSGGEAIGDMAAAAVQQAPVGEGNTANEAADEQPASVGGDGAAEDAAAEEKHIHISNAVNSFRRREGSMLRIVRDDEKILRIGSVGP